MSENKYIFIDCYATWCGPCKWMDKEIYPNNIAGQAINDRFLSIKVQFDTTKADNAIVKQWHSDAERIRQQFNVKAFPTLLFLSADGELLNKYVGSADVESFIQLVNQALDSNKQYDLLLKKISTEWIII